MGVDPDSEVRLWPIILKHRGAILLGLLLTLLTVLCTIGIPFIMRYLVDALIEGVPDRTAFIKSLLAFLLASLLAGWLSFWMRRLPLAVGHLVETELRDRVFRHLTRLDRDTYSSHHTGDLLNRMSSDMRTLALAIGQGFMQIGRLVMVFSLGYAAMFVVFAPLAGVMLALPPLMAFSFSRVARSVKRAHVKVQEELSVMAEFSQETFSGIQAIKAFAGERRRRALFKERNQELLRKNMYLARRHQLIHPLAAFWFATGTALILILGGHYVISGQITVGELVQFNLYLLHMQWPLLSLGWIVGLQQRGRASWKRVAEILEMVPRIADGPATDWRIRSIEGTIQFKHVSYVTDEGTVVLDDIHLTVRQGARIGITGPTGSGKTTLVSMLPRLLEPTTGVICMDGRPLQEVPLAVLRRCIGMAEQETTLFADTMARNLGFGLDQMTPEQLFAVADIAHLRGDVESFPDRFETMLGERGVTLSGGQRQRTAIGRAVARDPRILILDDVLASVDTATEAAIIEKLRPVFQNRTVLMVSHRVSALRDMDEILVIQEGRLAQQGNHTTLVRKPGYYQRLCEIQELAAVVA